MSVLDLQDRSSTVEAAARADVVRALILATVRTDHELWQLQELLTATVTTSVAADTLLGKGTHLKDLLRPRPGAA